MSGGALVAAAALGAFAWTLAEYLLHRFAGHGPRGRIGFSREHLSHHARPMYFTPTAKKVAIALVTIAVLGPPLALAVGLAPAAATVFGFTAAYAGYEVVHRMIHARGPRGPYSRFVRRHHLHHHFAAPKKNHGVTSPLWDLVFRTFERPERVRVPARHAMTWLLDQSGEVRPELAADYELRRRRGGTARSARSEVEADREAAFDNRPPAG